MRVLRDFAGHYTILAYGLKFTAELVDPSDPEPWELRQEGCLSNTEGRFPTLRACKLSVSNMRACDIQWCREQVEFDA